MADKIKQLERPLGNCLLFFKVLKETEKAYFVEPCKIYNTNLRKMWIPKCALVIENTNDKYSLRITKVKSWFLNILENKKIQNWI